jgi:hypothetical protein
MASSKLVLDICFDQTFTILAKTKMTTNPAMLEMIVTNLGLFSVRLGYQVACTETEKPRKKGTRRRAPAICEVSFQLSKLHDLTDAKGPASSFILKTSRKFLMA